MGDKTQLVALALGLRYRRPWTVLLGVLLATIANHALAATVGAAAAARVDDRLLGWLVGLAFLAFAGWTLVPDTAGDAPAAGRWGPLLTTTIVFFLAEMGDKTQLATVALAARFPSPAVVTAGTTAGMLAADGLALFAGARLGARVPLTVFRRVAAALFVLFGAASIAAAHFG